MLDTERINAVIESHGDREGYIQYLIEGKRSKQQLYSARQRDQVVEL